MTAQIARKLKELGYATIPLEFYSKVVEWKSWYIGDVKGFSYYTVRTGNSSTRCKRYSLKMAKKLSEDWANLLINEKVKITLEGTKEQAFIDKVFQNNNFWIRANEMQEIKSALGTVAYVPRVVGTNGSQKAAGIMLDCATMENIFPLSWSNGIVQECAFSSTFFTEGKTYVYLQIHRKGSGGSYELENHVYLSENENLKETELTAVKGFEAIPTVVHTGSSQRQFVIDRLNIANNFDYSLPVGVAVYANAIDVLKGVDIAYDSYVNEFVLGKKRIMVKPSATKFLNGQAVFDTSDTVYYVLPEDSEDNSVITPIDMSLRTEEHNRGIQDQLNLLSSKCGFGETYYRFGGGSIATATQVISENSTMFRTIKKHEIILESVLVELCRIILHLGNTAMNAGLKEDVEISVDFDDSIIEDKNSDFARDMQLLNAGIMNDWEFRAKWMNEDAETAKASLPRMEDMVTEVQEEIE